MEKKQELIDDVVIRLRENGLRLTPQRMAVLKMIIGNEDHLSVDEIYEGVRTDFPMVGLATVYKTISLLKSMGEINELNFDNGFARYDGRGGSPHPHFICNHCRDIIDIEINTLEDVTEKITKKTGYKILKYRLDFIGICPNCQKTQ